MQYSSYNCKILHIILLRGGAPMYDYITERVLKEGKYIIETCDTVRGAATHFNISKSTVHTVVIK